MRKPDLSTVAKARKAWSRALRSGKYRQGRYQLRSTYPKPAYCCLGVAGDLCVRAGLANWEGECLVGNGRGTMTQRTSGAILPSRVARVFGIRDQQCYALANDEKGLSFDVIANYIDRKITKKELLWK